jgi:hypothetical protein
MLSALLEVPTGLCMTRGWTVRFVCSGLGIGGACARAGRLHGECEQFAHSGMHSLCLLHEVPTGWKFFGISVASKWASGQLRSHSP